MPKCVPPAILLLVAWVAAVPLLGSSHRKDAAAVPLPAERILTAPLGYRPPGSLYMLSAKVFSSLDFIDAHHLLFTFRQARLLRREDNPGRFDNDQIIHALVLDLPGGNVAASAEWRMHDKSRYLWPLGDGKFLVRQRDSYALTDAKLALSPYIQVATPVFETEVSPDGHILVVEHEFEKHTPEEHRKLEEQAKRFGDPPPEEDIQITLMNSASREVLGALHTELPIHVPITANGYAIVERGKGDDQFEVRFVPFTGKAIVLGKVASTCTPHENFLNTTALVIESCGPKSPDAFLDVWTIDGKKLWSAQRDGRLVWPTFAYSRTGTRFAEGLLRVAHPIDLADSLNEEDVREQVVQVYDSASGKLLLATNASPILTGGQNFALSNDGGRLAILRNGAIEIYDVPDRPEAETPASPPAPAKK
jgi:hypothetical protein